MTMRSSWSSGPGAPPGPSTRGKRRAGIGLEDVNYVVTAPGEKGVAAAFAAEFLISFILMATLRLAYQHHLTKPYGYFAGVLLLVYITSESPLSGMSLNPARSVASAIPARNWNAIWIYFAAPILAMLLAVEGVSLGL